MMRGSTSAGEVGPSSSSTPPPRGSSGCWWSTHRIAKPGVDRPVTDQELAVVELEEPGGDPLQRVRATAADEAPAVPVLQPLDVEATFVVAGKATASKTASTLDASYTDRRQPTAFRVRALIRSDRSLVLLIAPGSGTVQSRLPDRRRARSLGSLWMSRAHRRPRHVGITHAFESTVPGASPPA